MTISLGEITMPVAPLGPENPLPPLAGPGLVTMPADMSAFAYGRPNTLLPYTVQDGYTRSLVDTAVKTAVLENEHLRAEFLLDYGARLWSLYHKGHKRELLHRNPVLQPANLALRNAWFAGGVEWNLGTTGHTPLTCAPMHAARVGENVLRLWEFERMRELVYQLDIWLDGEVLCVQVRLTNPHPHEVPVYWWSNIAVPQTPGMRVLAPAETAWQLGFDGVIRKVAAPSSLDFEHAVDFFYDIAAERQPYIAALDAGGVGLLHTSTRELRGRKLFHWGNSTGGQRWQEWLSPPGHPYLEIQAGLARTQLEHLPMPGNSQWTWLETYRLATGDDFDLTMPSADAALADREPTERLHRGSGWGALERHARAIAADHRGEDAGPGAASAVGASTGGTSAGGASTGGALAGDANAWAFPAATPFDDDTLGRDQASWLTLLETGTMPAPAPRLAPASYQVGPQWRQRLENANPHNWFTLYHLGVARWHAGDRDGACTAWESSHEAAPNPWALRNLAFAGDSPVERLRAAHAMVPGVRAIAVEAVQAMIDAGKPAEALTFIDRLVLDLRAHGRIRLLECRAALDAGRLDRAARIVDTGIVVDDLREGEDALDDLWFTYHTRRGTSPIPQLPCLYDFRTGAPQ